MTMAKSAWPIWRLCFPVLACRVRRQCGRPARRGPEARTPHATGEPTFTLSRDFGQDLVQDLESAIDVHGCNVEYRPQAHRPFPADEREHMSVPASLADLCAQL